LQKQFGGFFPYFGIQRKAVDAYITEITNSNLSPEIKAMTIANTKKTFKEFKNQAAIAEIAMKNAKTGTDFNESSKVDDDWLARFMDAAKFVSNEDMQFVWGRILAGEFEKPGYTPPQMTRVLSEITLKYAQIFTTLCSLRSNMLVCDSRSKLLAQSNKLIINYKDPIFETIQINFKTLSELHNYGLIEFSTMGFIDKLQKEIYPELFLKYGNDVIKVIDYPDNQFPIGQVLLTDVGACLANITETQTVEGYLESLKTYLTKNNVKLSEKQEIWGIDEPIPQPSPSTPST